MSTRPAKKPASALPRVTRTDQQEHESRRLLEAVLVPWPIRFRDKRDYGIDADVDVARPVAGTPDSEVTGRMFAVQLKATDDLTAPVSIAVTPGHLRHWLEHTLQVLLVSAHLPSQTLRARWIDERVFDQLRSRNPAFWSQESVSIPLADGFDLTSKSKSEIEASLSRTAQRALISPSRFFEVRQRVEGLATRLDTAGKTSGMESACELVARTRSALKLSAYTVAITGPQRVGKSTLVNALLGVSVSPVADYPTTAVPLLFESGDQPEAEVHFADGTKKTIAATAEALQPFAAQQHESDPDAKPVRLIRVSLPNDSFARGMALVDTPGLHDANEIVRAVTTAALNQADAVLYVLDAALGSKFKLGQHEIADLRELQQSKERLLIVLNQSDELEPAKRDGLLKYVARELEKYGLHKGLPSPPLFVSGLKAWQARVANEPPPPEFVALEDEMWGHLLRTRKSGLHRLESAVAMLLEGAEELGALTSERTTKGREAADVNRAKEICSAAGVHIRTHGRESLVATQHEIQQLIQGLITRGIAEWTAHINGLAPEVPLPSRDEVHRRLVENAVAAREQVWAVLTRALEGLASEFNASVRKALNDARVDLGMSPTVSFEAPNLPALSAIDLSIPEAGWGLLGLLGFFANPFLGFVATGFLWLMGRDVGLRRRRARVQKQLIDEYSKRLGEAYVQLARQTTERFIAAVTALYRQVEGRLDTFLRSAEHRISLLGKPLSDAEAAQLTGVRAEVGALQADLNVVADELRRLSR